MKVKCVRTRASWGHCPTCKNEHQIMLYAGEIYEVAVYAEKLELHVPPYVIEMVNLLDLEVIDDENDPI